MLTITLTTDFGNGNYLIAALKGSLIGKLNNCQIVDVSHQIETGDIYACAYVMRGLIPYYNFKSHHIVLCGLYINNLENILIGYKGDQYYYFTDNGFANLALPTDITIRKVKTDSQFIYNIDGIIQAITLSINYIQQGADWKAFTEEYTPQHKLTDLEPIVNEDSIKAQIIYIDTFKNVVVNLTQQEFETHRRGRNFRIEFYGSSRIDRIHHKYSEVKEGNNLCFFNNAGYLEIAVNDGNAADLFGLEKSTAKDNIYATVTIYFE